ncbi:hypothetical protein ACFV1N_05725 [Streptosporangium canum]|uniref:hypothetical protein n=1 Tax=Streptosporangium canum TaxID=324952 RepID=UPI0036A62232
MGIKGLHFHDLRHTGNTLAPQSRASLADLKARMGHDSDRAALIYQHATQDADQKIADALSARVEAEQRKSDCGTAAPAPVGNGPLRARVPHTKLRREVFWLVEPRRFELLTSCLQRRMPIMLDLRRRSSAP